MSISQQNIGSRTKLVFRRVVNGNPAVDSIQVTRYLQNVTTANIINANSVDQIASVLGMPTQPSTGQVIDIRTAVPGAPFTGTGSIPVYVQVSTSTASDGSLRYYIIRDGNAWFIQGAQANATGQTDVFTFYLNPQHIAPRYEKLRTPIKTLGGWEIQNWGNKLVDITVNATTGGMHRINESGQNVGLQPGQTIRDSTAWKRVAQLRQLYWDDQKPGNQATDYKWQLEYNGETYLGTFVSFQGPEEDAKDPFQMTYQFMFQADAVTTSPIGGMVAQ